MGKKSYTHVDTWALSSHRGRDYFSVVVGSAGGLGLSPIAPGTCGATLGIVLHVLVVLFLPATRQSVALVVAFLLVCLGTSLLTPWAEAYWHDRDPKHFVLDEVAGYLLVPILFRHGQLWQIVVWGFLLFRLCDIMKIPPAKQIDRDMHGAWGILLDDLVSAGYAVVALYGLMWLGPPLGLEAWLVTR